MTCLYPLEAKTLSRRITSPKQNANLCCWPISHSVDCSTGHIRACHRQVSTHEGSPELSGLIPLPSNTDWMSSFMSGPTQPSASVSDELALQLDNWFRHLPPSIVVEMNSDEDRNRQMYPRNMLGLLRGRYWAAKFVVYRPYVYKALSSPPENLTAEDFLNVQQCLEAGLKVPQEIGLLTQAARLIVSPFAPIRRYACLAPFAAHNSLHLYDMIHSSTINIAEAPLMPHCTVSWQLTRFCVLYKIQRIFSIWPWLNWVWQKRFERRSRPSFVISPRWFRGTWNFWKNTGNTWKAVKPLSMSSPNVNNWREDSNDRRQQFRFCVSTRSSVSVDTSQDSTVIWQCGSYFCDFSLLLEG